MVKGCHVGVGRTTREEWQELVDEFDPRKQSKRGYCIDKNIRYGSFKNWFYKLKAPDARNDGAKSAGYSCSAPDASSTVQKEANANINAINKEFVGFKLVANITTIKLPNGINIEVGSGDIVGLIRQLLHVV